MEIPILITSVDSRIKEVAYNCYVRKNGLNRNDFKRMIEVCASDGIREELRKYWKKMPLRMAKKSAKYSDEDWNFSAMRPDEPIRKKSQPKRQKNHIPSREDTKPTTSKEREQAISKERERKLKKLAKFTSPKKVKHLTERLDKFPDRNHFQFLFETYRYKYNEKDLARFLLAYCNRSLLDNETLLEEKVQHLINSSKQKQGESAKRKEKDTNTIQPKPTPKLTVVPWETIEFRNGSVGFYAFRLNGALILKERQPFTVQCPESRESYNYIKQHFINVLPDIKAYQQGADIVELESKLHLLDAIRLLKTKVEFADWNVDEGQIVSVSSFERAANQDQEKILARLRARKSLYFDHLVRLQRQSNKRIVPCSEQLIHSDGMGIMEEAFIFTLVSRNRNEIKLVFENVNEARASLVFIAAYDSYEKALRCIFDFMRSEECNKRQWLHHKKFHFSTYGILRYYITNHTTLREWSHNL